MLATKILRFTLITLFLSGAMACGAVTIVIGAQGTPTPIAVQQTPTAIPEADVYCVNGVTTGLLLPNQAPNGIPKGACTPCTYHVTEGTPGAWSDWQLSIDGLSRTHTRVIPVTDGDGGACPAIPDSETQSLYCVGGAGGTVNWYLPKDVPSGATLSNVCPMPLPAVCVQINKEVFSGWGNWQYSNDGHTRTRYGTYTTYDSYYNGYVCSSRQVSKTQDASQYCVGGPGGTIDWYFPGDVPSNAQSPDACRQLPPPPPHHRDVCPNIPGEQEKVPDGDVIDSNGNCVPAVPPPPPPATDVCPNIPGTQATVPDGDMIDDHGNCVPKHQHPKDVCPNIDGDQATVPDGDMIDDHGNCVSKAPPPPPATDVCPNINGNQATVPDGYHVDGHGDCVLNPPPPTDVCTNVPGGPYTHVPHGYKLNPDLTCDPVTPDDHQQQHQHQPGGPGGG